MRSGKPHLRENFLEVSLPTKITNILPKENYTLNTLIRYLPKENYTLNTLIR